MALSSWQEFIYYYNHTHEILTTFALKTENGGCSASDVPLSVFFTNLFLRYWNTASDLRPILWRGISPISLKIPVVTYTIKKRHFIRVPLKNCHNSYKRIFTVYQHSINTIKMNHKRNEMKQSPSCIWLIFIKEPLLSKSTLRLQIHIC